DLAVAFSDHPLVERRVQGLDVVAELLVELSIDGRAGLLALPGPAREVRHREILGCRGFDSGDPAPLARGVQGAREAGEQIGLQDRLLHPAYRSLELHALGA